MPKEAVTEKDRRLAREFMDSREQLEELPYQVSISKKNAIMIKHKVKGHWESVCVARLERETGRVLEEHAIWEIDYEIGKRTGNEWSPVLAPAPAVKKRTKRTCIPAFSDELLDYAREAVERAVEESFSEYASGAVLDISPDRSRILVSFSPVEEGMWTLRDAIFQKHPRLPNYDEKRAFSSSLAQMQPVISEFGKDFVVRSMKDIVSAWRKGHEREVGLFNHCLETGMSEVIPKGDWFRACVMCTDEFPELEGVSRQRDGWKATFDAGIGVVCAGEKKAGFDSSTEKSIRMYLAVCEYHDAISSVLGILDENGVSYSASFEIGGLLSCCLFSRLWCRKRFELDLNQSYREDLGQAIADFREEERSAAERENTRICEMPFTGNALAMGIAETVLYNPRELTPTMLVKVMRGLAMSEREITHGSYDGCFSIIPDDEIKAMIAKMVEEGILCIWHQRREYARYGSYDVLTSTDDTNLFLSMSRSAEMQLAYLGRDKALQHDIIRIDQLRRWNGSNDEIEAVSYVMEHPSIWCVAADDVSRWLGSVSDETLRYIELSYKLEEDKRIRKYYKQLVRACKEHVTGQAYPGLDTPLEEERR